MHSYDSSAFHCNALDLLHFSAECPREKRSAKFMKSCPALIQSLVALMRKNLWFALRGKHRGRLCTSSPLDLLFAIIKLRREAWICMPFHRMGMRNEYGLLLFKKELLIHFTIIIRTITTRISRYKSIILISKRNISTYQTLSYFGKVATFW